MDFRSALNTDGKFEDEEEEEDDVDYDDDDDDNDDDADDDDSYPHRVTIEWTSVASLA